MRGSQPVLTCEQPTSIVREDRGAYQHVTRSPRPVSEIIAACIDV